MATPLLHSPIADSQQLAEALLEAASAGQPVEPIAGGSKRAIARPGRSAAPLDLSALAGVVDYEPSELVLTVRPGTPLTEIEILLAGHGQMLAFEPWDHGPLLGAAAGRATIGGVVVAGVAGSRRVSAGGARDHLLGFCAVSGRGEAFKAGGKVVKNVTGFDLSKVVAGSWGRLALLTELSLKVVPRPERYLTLGVTGLAPAPAVALMARALGSAALASAAAHCRPSADGPAMTWLRFEGYAASTALRLERLAGELATHSPVLRLDEAQSRELWQGLGRAATLNAAPVLWRAQIAPSAAAALVEALELHGARWLIDWAGALVWIGAEAESAAAIRDLVSQHGGHASLVRAPEAVRRAVPIRHPQPAGRAALAERVRRAFDPAGILDPERFG